MTTPNWKERTELMLGKECIGRMAATSVLIVGVGGVGAYTAEMLARAGIGKITMVDADEVSDSNRNRQLTALTSTVGKPKVEVLAQRLTDINPEIEITAIKEYLRDERTIELLESRHFDYVADAIDTLAPKVFLIHQAHQRGIKVISSMGSGGKTDPMQVKTDDISRSDYCKLARMVRKRLHKLGLRKGVMAVYSPEVVPPERMILTEGEQNKKSNVGTISYMPAIFGCQMAAYIINDIAETVKKEQNELQK